MRARKALVAAAGLLLATRASALGADAVLLVNSTSSSFGDAQRFVRPYLDHFGVPYTVLDVAAVNVGPEIGDHALIVIGHAGLDPDRRYLDATEQTNISNAVSRGAGLVNFDHDLTADGTTPRYQFIQDVFGFGYGPARIGTGVLFTSDAPAHYVSSRHAAGSTIATAAMEAASLTAPGNATVVARVQSTGYPLVAVTTFGQGRALQWGTYDWASVAVLGPVHGLDDLVWRGMAWAARKPFVMQGMPNFLTMRVDDVVGGFWWVSSANQFQLKPWLGVFYPQVSEVGQLSSLANSGNATVSVHARTGGDFFYYDHQRRRDHPDATVAAYFQDATSWHIGNNIPVSSFVVPHFYEIGTNVFNGLQSWGVQFLATHMAPGQPYEGSPWIMGGPYRLYETGSSVNQLPVAYADYVTIPGHPELANRFFNCVTEIRDDAGYEWAPDNDVAGSIGRGTRQLRRALDSMTLATLFTHEYYIQPITAGNWQAILSGVVGDVASYNPAYVTMDYACRYVRAKHDSKISSASFDPGTQTLTTDLTGSADIPTQFYVFTSAGDGTVLQAPAGVPAFSGSARVTRQLGGPLHHIDVTPALAQVAAGARVAFAAQGFDAAGNPVAGLTYAWSAAAGGTVDQGGLFTAGAVPGTFTNAVRATAAGVAGQASVEVYAQALHHFGFDPIAGPVYAGSPFGVRITAYDQAGSVIAGYTGQAQLEDLTGTLSPAATGSFAGGVWSGDVTVGLAVVGDAITVSSGAASGTSESFDVQAAPAASLTIWPSSAAPGNVHGADSPVELGVKFRSDVAGYISGIRFYKAASNTGTHVGNLWTSGGALLATATFSGETASGWQQVSFPAPVPISASTVYVASYHTNVGYYAQNPGYFASQGVDNPPLHVPSGPSSGGNGVYAYGAASSFPSGSFNSTNYWVDVVFTAAATTP